MKAIRSLWLIAVLGVVLGLGLLAKSPTPARAITDAARPDRDLAQTSAAITPTQKTVLVLFPFQPDLPVGQLALQTMQAEFGSVDDLMLTVYYEFLDSNRFSDSVYQQQLFDLYATKYQDKPIDLVMIETETTLSAWLKQRDNIAPNAPVVYFDTLSETFAAWSLPPNVTGVSGVLDYTPSIEWIMRARPAVNEVILIHGVGAIDLAPDNIRPVEAFVQDMGRMVRITDLSNLPLPEITRRVAALPQTTVVLSHPVFEDAAGDKYNPSAVLRQLTDVSPVPVISGFDLSIGTGTIGGSLYSLEEQTRQAAQIGLRILRGEPAGSIPPLRDQRGPFIFDHLALQRYDIPLSALPPDSIIKNRQYSLWELYQGPIIVAAVTMTILLILVVVLILVTRRLNTARLALSRLNANLETQVQERTAALRQTNQTLELEIAERARVEAALRESEARFRSYFELPLTGRAITSPDKGWIDVNATLCEMLAYTRAELMQMTWAELTHPDDIAADLIQFNRVMDGEIDGYILEKRFLRKDGGSVYSHLVAQCLRRPDRSVDYFVALIQDITERKQAEATLRNLNATLEQRVLERTAELQAANRRLTELDHLKDEFLSRISHELRTPLTSVKIYVELLETAKPEKRDKYLQTLKREADRLHTLIEEVLMFSQLNRTLELSTLAPIDLNNLIEGRLTTWQTLSAGHDLHFKLDLAHNLPHTRADSELVMQALIRLITNAVNYTPAGSVTVSTTCVDADDQRWITISVTDTGPGITPDDLPHIFERFYRGRAAADYRTPGVGVGLSISREIAEKLGGRLTVETQVGAGSIFTVWLPAS